MRKALSLLAIIGLLATAGCTTTQCRVAQTAFGAAQAGYESALMSGNTGHIDKGWWAVNATAAIVAFWCAEAPTTTEEAQ